MTPSGIISREYGILRSVCHGRGRFQRLLLFVFLLACVLKVQAQSGPGGKILSVRGTVRDSLQRPVPGVVVSLIAGRDTLRTSSDTEGLFKFSRVSSKTFALHLSSIGYKKLDRSFSFGDAGEAVVIPPIVLSESVTELDEVKIRLKHGIKFREDTTEYHAGDYQVRPNDAVGKLLRVMEGMDVDNNKGTLKYQGKAVSTVRINGKEYAASDMAQVLKSLPADIVDKIQIIDDYGDMARLTGIREGEATKVLNITTRTDRSVGATLYSSVSYGNNNNLLGSLFLQNFNANRQLGLSGSFSNSHFRAYDIPASFGSDRPSEPGYSRSLGPGINFRDQLSKNIQLTLNYAYSDNSNRNSNNSYGQNNTTLGVNNFIDQSKSFSGNKSHNLNAQLDYKIDTNNTLQVTLGFTESEGTNNADSYRRNINKYTTGFEHQEIEALNGGKSKSPNLRLTSMFVHKFRKKDRLFSVQYALGNVSDESENEGKNTFRFYADSTRNLLVSDSAAHIIATRNNESDTHRLNVNYTEPLSKSSRIEILARYDYRGNDSRAISDSVMADGTRFELSRLSNVFRYEQEQFSTGLNYRYKTKSLNLALGASLLRTSLSGRRQDRQQGRDLDASIRDTRIIPSFRASYGKTQSERLTLNYRASSSMPQFSQIQPFVDLTDANNVVIGNPDLKPSFSHVIDLSYNRFMKTGMGIGLNVSYSYEQDQIQSNIIQRLQTINQGGASISRSINETRFVNVSGADMISLGYNLSKGWKQKYNLNYGGQFGRNVNMAMSNDVLYKSKGWRVQQNLSANMSPVKNLDIFPSFSYSLNHTSSELQNAIRSTIHNYLFMLDVSAYLFESYRLNMTMNKSITRGYEQLGNPSPLLLGAGFYKEFFKKRSLTLGLNVNDLLNQNNSIQQSQTAAGYTNTLSANQGRTVTFSLGVNLQRWGGTPKRKGKTLQRRGDGSFIY